ncbi:hypothetical protein [Paenarthrobacter sp. 22069]|uniref:hypothetical protein n=1 Tax=Paenarthrobacter sp. 22069 TaxID=3453864 RepID=UPI003F8771BE
MNGRVVRRGRTLGLRPFLVVVFVVAASGSLALVAVDLVIGRPAGGDVFIAVLNSLVAAVSWRRLAPDVTGSTAD